MDILRRRILSLFVQFSSLAVAARRIIPISSIFSEHDIAITGLTAHNLFTGQTANLIITGKNLAGTYAITFDQKGFTTRILATHYALISAEVVVSDDVTTRPIGFTLHTASEKIHSSTFNTYLAVQSSSAIMPAYGYGNAGYGLRSYSRYYNPHDTTYINIYGYCCGAFLGVGGEFL